MSIAGRGSLAGRQHGGTEGTFEVPPAPVPPCVPPEVPPAAGTTVARRGFRSVFPRSSRAAAVTWRRVWCVSACVYLSLSRNHIHARALLSGLQGAELGQTLLQEAERKLARQA